MATVADISRRIPFRLRLTLTFAAVMIVLFGGLALLLYPRVAASLDDGIDNALHTRAADVTALTRGVKGPRLPPLPESGGAFAQIVTPQGGVLDATPGHLKPLLSGAEVRRALRAPLLIDRREDSRVLAQPSRIGDPVR